LQTRQFSIPKALAPQQAVPCYAFHPEVSAACVNNPAK
jgi:hypothetical protein